jgi:hypothetical protein
MQDAASELPRIPIPRTRVNKGMRKGPEQLRPGPTRVGWCVRSVIGVDGFDALALVLKSELLVAALLARLLVLKPWR